MGRQQGMLIPIILSSHHFVLWIRSRFTGLDFQPFFKNPMIFSPSFSLRVQA